MNPRWVKVAELARAAHTENRQMSAAVAEYFCVSLAEAQGMIKSARARGLSIPYTQPPNAPRSLPIQLLRLVCTCGETFRVDRFDDLSLHCRYAHHRRALPIERTPRPVEFAA